VPSLAKMVWALAAADVKSARNSNQNLQGLKPHFFWPLYGTTKVVP
jgi:hypothetical protein